jgi:predicted metalloendopeptidase
MKIRLIVKGSSLPAKYSQFNWNAFWDGINLPTWKKNSIKIYSPSWIVLIEKYLKYLLLNNGNNSLQLKSCFMRFLFCHHPMTIFILSCMKDCLRGQKEKLPQQELTLRLLQEWMPNTMSRLYLRHYIEPNLKTVVTNFTNLIRTAAIDRIQNTSWLVGTYTTGRPLIKSRKCLLVSHILKKCQSFPELNLQTDDLLKNILLLGEDSTKSEMMKLNKTIDIKNRWDDAIDAVNAYYYSESKSG